MCNTSVLGHYDPTKPVVLQTDASRLNGLGFVLMQQDEKDIWRVILCGSRFIADAETRYSIIELELLAVVWAASKCKIYLLGRENFSLVVDHRPLVSILDKKRLDQIENPRLRSLKEKLSPYRFTTKWVKGKNHSIPDALSRAPISVATRQDEEGENEVDVGSQLLINQMLMEQEKEDPIMRKLKNYAKMDDNYEKLVEAIKKGFPKDKKKCSIAILPYWNIKDELSVEDSLALFGMRIVVPHAARKSVLQKLHTAHQGINRTKQRARQTVYWPGLNNEITNLVSSCQKCQENLPSLQKEPLISEKTPTRIFQDVSLDFFEVNGHDYLVYIDRFSSWPILAKFRRGGTKAEDLIRACHRIFKDVGVPVILRSDGGPQFKSFAFKKFIEQWGINHVMSSPYHHQSNGFAESAVKSMKSLITKIAADGNIDSEEFNAALLELRNTPNAGGLSPSQIVFGHSLRSLVPAHHLSFDSKWNKTMIKYDKK